MAERRRKTSSQGTKRWGKSIPGGETSLSRGLKEPSSFEKWKKHRAPIAYEQEGEWHQTKAREGGKGLVLPGQEFQLDPRVLRSH